MAAKVIAAELAVEAESAGALTERMIDEELAATRLTGLSVTRRLVNSIRADEAVVMSLTVGP